MTLGRRGVTRTLGIPGTGLSHTTHMAGTHVTKSSAPGSARRRGGGPTVAVRKGIDPARFHISPQPITSAQPTIRILLFVVGAIVLIGGFWVSVALPFLGLMIMMLGLTIPSGRRLKEAEVDRCWLAADTELVRRVTAFNGAVTEMTTATLASLQHLLELQERYGLSDVEAGAHRILTIRGGVELLEFEAAVLAAGGRMQVVPSDEKVTAPDVC
jgi:hypothetical protein